MKFDINKTINTVDKVVDTVKDIKETYSPSTEYPPVKPGWKTTEFWLALTTSIAGLLGTVAGVVPPKVGGVMMTLSTSLYAISRAVAKF